MLTRTNDPARSIRDLSGIGPKLSKKIIEELGEGDPWQALAAIERNPFSLTDVDGIAFRKADKVALDDFGIRPDDVRRHEAGNRYVLEQKGVLTEREYFAERVKLELRDPAHKHLSIEVEDGLYWLPEELEAEQRLERWMRGLPRIQEDVPLAELTESQQAVCDRLKLDEQQTRAVRGILANQVMCLTGPAGSGKTHIIAAAAQALSVVGKSVRGMAFAGKAADRMREAFETYGILAEATTIHKALGFMRKMFTVELLGETLIVIDEASMLPNWLLWAVVKRLAPGVHLVLVGDPNQLPPIGQGTPFVDLLAWGVAHVHLLKNYRQQDQQGILHMAEGVLNRSRPSPASCVELHLGVDSAELEQRFDALVREHGGQDFESWQIITYQNENAERYNLRAQAIINPEGTPLFEYPLWKLGTGERGRPLHHAEIREGDKIIVVKNSSTLDIFNGQTGRVTGSTYKPKVVQRRDPVTGRWDEHQGESMRHLCVQITGRRVDIPEDEMEKYVQLGYVITVHKAQGSDWNRVIVMQPGKVREDTARRFFYTAITRAKTHLVIVSTLRTVAWWTNAAADAPDEPSTLLKRLARPAPCIWCEYDGCAVCKPEEYPELPELAEPDWEEEAEQRHEAAEAAARAREEEETAIYAAASYEADILPHEQAAAEEIGVEAPLLITERRDLDAHLAAPWRTLRGHVAQAPDHAAQAVNESLLLAAKVEEVQAQFRTFDLDGVA